MKHTYNNWSTKIFEGFYESGLYDSDTLCLLEESHELKNNEHYDIEDWTGFTNDVAIACMDNLLDILPDDEIIQAFKFKEIHSPEYYNYETDSLILDVKLNLHKLKKYCFKTHRNNFNEYLKINFTSRDGFISYIANNINDFILDYNSKTTPNDREINIMIEYYLLCQIYDSVNPNDFQGNETIYHESNYEAASEIINDYLVLCTN